MFHVFRGGSITLDRSIKNFVDCVIFLEPKNKLTREVERSFQDLEDMLEGLQDLWRLQQLNTCKNNGQNTHSNNLKIYSLAGKDTVYLHIWKKNYIKINIFVIAAIFPGRYTNLKLAPLPYLWYCS